MGDRDATARRVETDGAGPSSGEEMPLSQLLRELAVDARRLVRDEIGLAKLELGQTARSAATDGALVGAGALVASLGVACLVAALVVGAGVLLGSYWMSSALVGVVLVVGGAVSVKKGLERVRSVRVAPEQTIDTLRDDVAWAGDEVRAMRRDWSRS